MFDKQTLQCFFSGFLSVFRLGAMPVPVKQIKSPDVAKYFCQIENDINRSYKKLIKSHERK